MSQLQQQQFASTIRAMKRAMKRHTTAVDDRYDGDAGDDDSDEYAPRAFYTNRGNKLRHEAQRVQRGRLADTDGRVYKKNINHAGYIRSIISRNPAYIDSEGDLHSSPSASSDDEADRTPTTADPYASIHIDQLLRPLTSAAELPVHPTYSLPYKSTALNEMLADAEETLRRERVNLWKAKAVLARFRRDADWVPCGVFDADDSDELLFGEQDRAEIADEQMGGVEEDVLQKAEMTGDDTASAGQQNGVDVTMEEAGERQSAANGSIADTTTAAGVAEQDSTHQTNNMSSMNADNGIVNAPATSPPSEIRDGPVANVTSETESTNNTINQHAMTTRARARSPVPSTFAPLSPRSTDSFSADPPPVHPWFLAPGTCHPAADLALPTPAFQETRQLLLFYVQKQEQIVRLCEGLFAGLAKAERQRRDVYESCKSEAHMIPLGIGRADPRTGGVNAVRTEMSDGEDWVDHEALGLAPNEVLEKGKDEVEDFEEETVTARMVRGGAQVPTRRGGRRRVVG